MAPSVRRASVIFAAAALIGPFARPSAAVRPAQAAQPVPPISLVAQSSEIDYRNNDLIFRKVRISQGTMSVEADLAHATGLDFENSHWVFRGNVKIIVNQGELHSDDADILFANKLLAQASVTGKPADFQQGDVKSARVIRGHAERIDYDLRKGIVELSRNAWLSDGKNEIRGQTLKYDIAARSVLAAAADQGAQRVHITITPPRSNQKP